MDLLCRLGPEGGNSRYMVKEEDSSEKVFDDDEILPEHMRGVELDIHGVLPLVM